jgi:hypothetical protein
MLFLAGASLGVALGLSLFLPDPCRSVPPTPDLERVDDTYRDTSGHIALWVDRSGLAFERRACAD